MFIRQEEWNKGNIWKGSESSNYTNLAEAKQTSTN